MRIEMGMLGHLHHQKKSTIWRPYHPAWSSHRGQASSTCNSQLTRGSDEVSWQTGSGAMRPASVVLLIAPRSPYHCQRKPQMAQQGPD